MKIRPVTFSCEATVELLPEEIVSQILEPANWKTFTGYGLIPGIRSATFEIRTPELIGTRVRVVNTDRSCHVEELVAYQPGQSLVWEMKEFSPPLSYLATKLLERWVFHSRQRSTHVVRSFELIPRSWLAKPVLWLISWFLCSAVRRHLHTMHHPQVV